MFSQFLKNLFSGDNMDERFHRLRKDIREEFVQQQSVFEKNMKQRLAVYALAFAAILSFAGWQMWGRMQDDMQKINSRLDKMEIYLSSDANRTINVINNIDKGFASEYRDITLQNAASGLSDFSSDRKPGEIRQS